MDDVGIMLPDDEAALLSGALDCLDLNESPGQVLDALEDYDLFCGGGKMELDSDPKESITVGSSLGNVNHRYTLANGVGTISVAHPHGEHPSRTLCETSATMSKTVNCGRSLRSLEKFEAFILHANRGDL
ncbi:unnamed protein product [Musa textilis]